MTGKAPLNKFLSWITSAIKKTLPKIAQPRTHYGRNIKLERQILHYVNQERREHGISSLTWNNSLYYDVQRRAKELTRDFRHKNIPHGCGENIAMVPLGNVKGLGHVGGKNIARSFVKTWMKSSGHRENILRSSYSSSCIGVAKRGRYYYATQLFS
jgi:uncharacterized protein YkwD